MIIQAWDILLDTIGYHHNQFRTCLGQLEVGDDLGDVSVHLVQLGVLGGRLLVLAASHHVHKIGVKTDFLNMMICICHNISVSRRPCVNIYYLMRQ